MCLSPLHIDKKLPNGRVRSLVVPCGTCAECLKKRQSSIVVRSYVESLKHPAICMFTLTYNDDKLPRTEDGEVTLRREDIKNWKKEFRKLIFNKDFSWICSGEYSPRGFHRPHYHGIFFGLDAADLKIIENCWSNRYGFTVFKTVSTMTQKDLLNVARYISKYVVKDSEFRSPSLTVEQPRLMTSVGFGYPDDRFWYHALCFDRYHYDPFVAETVNLEIAQNVCDNLYFPIGGMRYSIPIYAIRKKLYYKDSSGALRPSPLWQMVCFVKRFVNLRVSLDEFKSFCACNSQRSVFENAYAFDKIRELSSVEKQFAQREDIISAYKSSKI